jgi:hypothetical protein
MSLRVLCALPALMLVPAMAMAADHNITFEVGTSYYLPAQRPLNKGFGNFFAIDVPVSIFEAGYYFESLQLKIKADEDTTTPETRADASVNMHEVRVAVPLADNIIRIGLGIGAADVKGDNTANATTFEDMGPVMEVFASVQPLRGGDKVKAAINVLVGYRFIFTDEIDPDGGALDYATDAIDNINGFRFGLSATLSF